MKFVDKAKIFVKGGDGGNGVVAFRREKFVPMGGPAGGNGGKGGDVVLIADSRIRTLLDFKHKIHFKAERGQHGSGNNKHGKKGEDLIIKVPVGTVVTDAQTGQIIADLKEEGQKVIVAKGGRGGKGNASFKTSTNQTPDYAEEGEKGEERWIELELKLIADIGIVGFPNAGKSTLISVLSNAKPKIADYPFTTLAPVLGVMKIDYGRSVVLADIPGLIEGASRGQGLGHEFLRHIERTKALIHMIDISDFAEREPVEAFNIINEEMGKYSPQLLEKPQLVVGNKIDLLSDRKKIEGLKKYFEEKGFRFVPVSLATLEGIDTLKKEIISLYEKTQKESQNVSKQIS
ncbi:GTPase ObgE [Persephonella atlantica]|uniref:GTPase Obg n=1 Tax=Persephonella atlantica TaxID=2699429 RepID=A0ABS1GIH7_9AQUI|nr:GTPase ObgE [Persephonella atlantica]MBK3332738.1 GTPase ObgE [Persephonella atlantica]